MTKDDKDMDKIPRAVPQVLLGCLLLCLALAALLTGLYLRFQSFSFLFMKSISSFNVSHSLFLKCVTTSFHPYFYVQGSSRETRLTGKLIVIPTNLKNTNTNTD